MARLASKTFDTVICGGAAVGSSVAYFLAAKRLGLLSSTGSPSPSSSPSSHSASSSPSILVIEKDSSYKHSATALCAASFRTQFSTPENIQMSLFGGHFLKTVNTYLGVEGQNPVQLQLHEQGYLFLGSKDNAVGLKHLRENYEVQKKEGAKLALLDQKALKERYPWMKVDDIELASLGLEGEGWLDAYSLLQAYKSKAQSLGVTFVSDRVTGLKMSADGSSVEGVKLASGETVFPKHFVNASGTHCDEISKMAGFSLPVRPRRRCIFVFKTHATLPHFPMLIDTTGLYVRPEGPPGQYLCGISPASDLDPDVDAERDFDVDHSLFTDIIWPGLAERVPAFESLKLTSAWAGHYAFNTFDHNIIVGRHPTVRNMLLANGCSGHGLMHSPAVGRALSELIEEGKYVTVDLSRFGYERLGAGRKIVEKNVI